MATYRPDRSRLPLPEPKFQGVIGKTYVDSKDDWPQVPKPPDGAPNVVVILLDDVGFGQVSTFGGPVPTPQLGAAKGASLQPLSYHNNLRPVASCPDHGTQPSQLRSWVSRRVGDPLPQLQQHDSEKYRLAGKGPVAAPMWASNR